MSLAWVEMTRAKLRYGLLAAAVALLVFLVIFLATLSNALLSSFVGGLATVRADAVVYSEAARDNPQASRLPASAVEQVAAVPGVAAAAPWQLGTFTGRVGDGTKDELTLIGFTPDGPGAPGGLAEGRLPTAAGEVALDGGGAALNDQLVVEPGGTRLTVVGLLRGAQLNAQTTAWTTTAGYETVFRAAVPGAPLVPVNAVAVRTDPGADPTSVASAVAGQVPGTKGYTVQQAVDAVPGVGTVQQTFSILVGLSFVIGVVVVAFFFLILTVQKLKVFTLLRGLGTSTGRLAGVVTGQIAAVVLLASAIAVGLAALAIRGLSTGIPVRLEPGLVATTVLAVLGASLAAGLLSVRRIAALDPAAAAGAR